MSLERALELRNNPLPVHVRVPIPECRIAVWRDHSKGPEPDRPTGDKDLGLVWFWTYWDEGPVRCVGWQLFAETLIGYSADWFTRI